MTTDKLPKGVCRNGNRYRATLTRDGVIYSIGTFASAELASEAYNTAAKLRSTQLNVTYAHRKSIDYRKTSVTADLITADTTNPLWTINWITQS